LIDLTASIAYRIAVPLANPANVRPLITLACGLAGDRRSEIVAFCVLRDRVRSEVGGGRSPVAQARERLAMAVEAAHRWEVPVRTEVVAHRDVVTAISEKTREIGANLLVMGWRAGSPRSGGFRAEEVDRIVEHAGCDVAILKPAARAGAFRRVLVTDLRGDHSALAAEFGMAIAERFSGELHRLELVRPGTQRSEPADVSIVRAEVEKPAERPRLMVAHSTTEGILGAARGFDLVIVGMERRGLSRQLLYGNRLEAISSRANASILVVRSAARPVLEPPMNADERR
jgi:nucleotide-binding universal stress UspA family protein